ncbi:MAG TPA: hypothetical protein VGX24_08585 [Pyrinomonadaceae bacterium]|jgi:hypothetical protein|nr:hypothetical protein [Pyrinomonadaceae bacterium]
MFRQYKLRVVMAAFILIALGLSTTAFAVQKKSDKPKKPIPAGTPVMWREPTDIASRDLFLGSGGEEAKPDLSSVTLIEKVQGGFSEKYRVRDAAGREWVAKVSNEAQSEAAAVRLLWAVGYVTELTYLAPSVTIPGTPKGTYQNVRFEGRSKDVKRLEPWLWDKNPFLGKREFQGLKVMMLLLNNWDIKDDNNAILHVVNPEGQSELHYIVSDLGATFGKIGSGPLWALKRSRNNPEDFAESKFVNRVEKDRVVFHYGGKKQDTFEDISVGDVQWIAALLSRLTDEQISDAFHASNYTDEEVMLLTSAVRARINELVNLSPSQS